MNTSIRVAGKNGQNWLKSLYSMGLTPAGFLRNGSTNLNRLFTFGREKLTQYKCQNSAFLNRQGWLHSMGSDHFGVLQNSAFRNRAGWLPSTGSDHFGVLQNSLLPQVKLNVKQIKYFLIL